MMAQTLKVLLIVLYAIKTLEASQNTEPPSEDTLKDKYGEVKYVAILFRHGNRIAELSFPTDPYQNYSWPFELSQLTNEGKTKAFNLGKYFKKRYSSLTGETYKPSKVIMHASSYDRTLMSGQLFYAGYFEPKGHEIWNKELAWQPIPVHSAPELYDNVLRMSKPCPRLDKLIPHFFETSPVVKKLCTDYADKLKYFEKHTKTSVTPCNSETAAKNLIVAQDTLLTESEQNLTLPEWTKEIFPQPLNHFRDILFYIEASDPKVKRILAAPLLNVVARDMANIAGIKKHYLPRNIYTTDPKDTRPMHLFAGHDTNILTLTRALKVYNDKAPKYSAALAFELRQKDGKYYVTVIKENSLDEPPELITLPNCEENCPLSKFLSIVTPLIPKNWEAECKNTNISGKNPAAQKGSPKRARRMAKIASASKEEWTWPESIRRSINSAA